MRERGLLTVQTCHLLVALFELCLHGGVLLLQTLIQAVQRVDLHHVVAQNGTHRGEFLLQTGYLTGIRGLHAFQFLEQLLGLHLLLRQLLDDRVVVDLRLHLTVLQCESLVFILHLLLVEFSQFLHVLIDLLLLLKTQKQPDRTCYQRKDEQY